MGSISPPQTNGNQKPRRVYLLTSPRTASNLFVKIINAPGQPEVVPGKFYGGYFFMPPFMYRDELNSWDIPVNELSDEEKEKLGVEYQKSADLYREHLETTERDGKICFIKEHINLLTKPTLQDHYMHGTPEGSIPDPWSMTFYKDQDSYAPSNPTMVPDNLLTSFLPTILIRHPAIQFPSLYRAQAEGFKRAYTPKTKPLYESMYRLNGMRRLYDFLHAHFKETDPSGPWPLVLDAADFITHPGTVVKHFCNLTGFDFAHCQFNWEHVTPEQEDALKLTAPNKRMLSTINASTGIQLDKAMADVDVDVEAVKWRKEFGEELGTQMEKWVRDALPDYKYLWEKRWNPIGKEEEVEAEGDAVEKNLAAQLESTKISA